MHVHSPRTGTLHVRILVLAACGSASMAAGSVMVLKLLMLSAVPR